jgi:hypothetical protein
MPKRLKNSSKIHKLFQPLTTLSIDKLRKSAALSFHDNFPDRILYCWCSSERE